MSNLIGKIILILIPVGENGEAQIVGKLGQLSKSFFIVQGKYAKVKFDRKEVRVFDLSKKIPIIKLK